MKKSRSVDEVNEETFREDQLRDYFVWWDSVQKSDLQDLKNTLDSAKREEDIQSFLQNNPKLLIQHLGGGHGRWVIPKKKLGTEHITDFVVGEKSSLGFEWQAIELESPTRPLFNKNGDPSQYLNHAIRQIQDWRIWLTANQNYAARPISESGLGLTDITGTVRGLIVNIPKLVPIESGKIRWIERQIDRVSSPSKRDGVGWRCILQAIVQQFHGLQ